MIKKKKRKHNQRSDLNINKELQIMEFAEDNRKRMPKPARHKKPKQCRSDLIVSQGTCPQNLCRLLYLQNLLIKKLR